VAATLALTFTAGGMWFYLGEGEKQASAAAQNASSSLSAQQSPALLFDNDIQTVSAKEVESKVEPWVDQNNILRFEDRFTNQDNIAGYDAAVRNSTQKLRLIENPVFDQRPAEPIQLTGTGN